MQQIIITLIGTVGTITVALLGLIKVGYLQVGKKDKELSNIKSQLDVLATNHIEHVQKGIDRLIEMQEEENKLLSKFDVLLTDIRDNTKKYD